MASADFTVDALDKTGPPGASQGELPLFRFGLRQLLYFVAAVSAILAVLALSGGLPAAVMLLGILVVIMHVFATALGSRLRERADRTSAFESSHELPIHSIASAAERQERLEAMKFDPRSPWHARGTTVLPWLRRLVIVAIACGGVAGAVYLAVTIGFRTSPAGVIVGGLSVAVLFGWIAFLVGSFYGVFRHGFREAVAEQQKQMPRDW
jgi:hypothetical protein